MWANRGYYVRYAVPHIRLNALRARFLGGGIAGAAPPQRGQSVLCTPIEVRTRGFPPLPQKNWQFDR